MSTNRLRDIRRYPRRILGAVGLSIFLAVILPSIGLAHATLVRSDPADGAILEETPTEIRMWFDEPVSAQFSTAQLFDTKSQPVEVTGVQMDPADPTLLVLDLPELSQGVYSVLYKTISESDGHISQGLLVFGVGDEVNLNETASLQPKEILPKGSEVILRWVFLALVAGFIGGVAVAQLVLDPARVDAKNEPTIVGLVLIARNRTLRFASICATLALVVGVGLLLTQARALQETLPEGATASMVTWQILSKTRWGGLWLVREGLLFILMGMVVNLKRYTRYVENQFDSGLIWMIPRTRVWVEIWLFSLGLIVTQALSSHAAGLDPNRGLAVITHGLHLLAASFWIGGLLALAVGILPLLRESRANLDKLIRISWGPFSKVAALSVGILFATGFYNTGRQVASLDALLTTLYGQVLLGKIGLVLGVGAVGLVNSILLHPWLAAPLAKLLGRPVGWTPIPVHRLPRLVVLEGSLGLLVLLVTGLVTAAQAPRDSSFTVDPRDVPGALSQTVGDMVMTLSAKPNRPGQNVFTVFAASTRRPPPAEIARVILRFNYLDQDIGRESVALEEIEPGRFLLGGNYLRLAGNWQIDVVVRRLGMEDSVARFDWVVAPPGEARPVVVSKAPLEATLSLAAAAMLLFIPLAAVGLFWLKRSKAKRSFRQGRTEILELEFSKRDGLHSKNSSEVAAITINVEGGS